MNNDAILATLFKMNDDLTCEEQKLNDATLIITFVFESIFKRIECGSTLVLIKWENCLESISISIVNNLKVSFQFYFFNL